MERLYLAELADGEPAARMPSLHTVGGLTDRLTTLAAIMQEAHAYQFGRLASPHPATARSADVRVIHDAGTGTLTVTAFVGDQPWELGSFPIGDPA